MLSVSVTLPLSDEDKTFLRELLRIDSNQWPAEKPKDPEPEPVAQSVEPETTEDALKDAQERAMARARELLDADQAPKVKAGLEKAGAARVGELSSVDACEKFLKAVA